MTAAFFEAPPFDGRVFTLRDCCRVIFGSAIIGLGTVAVACVTAGFIIVAAAWIVAASLSTNPYFHSRTSIRPETIVLNYRYPTISVLTDRGHAPDGTLEAKFTPTAIPASGPANTPQLLIKRSAERVNDITSLPRPASPPRIVATPEIAYIADSIADAELIAAAPSSALVSGAAVPPVRATEPLKSGQGTPQVVAALPPPSSSQSHLPTSQGHKDSIWLPGSDSHTAVYDIGAHTVYMPDGDKLEAHSGLGKRLDDPRYVSEKNRGPTPPNVYDLVLRGEPFHGVRAIRLNPVDEDNMFGRDGMLAHTYMLGPSGQSFGCVSFRNYHAFLQAFLEGEIDRLIVVPHLGATASRHTPSRHRHADIHAPDHG